MRAPGFQKYNLMILVRDHYTSSRTFWGHLVYFAFSYVYLLFSQPKTPLTHLTKLTVNSLVSSKSLGHIQISDSFIWA